MKPAMKQFAIEHKDTLRRFRLTGTGSTGTMLKSVLDPPLCLGPVCQSGPLGGDAQVATQIALEDIGAVIFFTDPLTAHPHHADIESLIRLCNVHNILSCYNAITANALMQVMETALNERKPEMIPSFFQTLESPSVAVYKAQQAALVSGLSKK